MKASFWFLVFLLFAVFLSLFWKTPSIGFSTGQAVLENEAYLTTEAFYPYAVLLGAAIIVCFVIWYFNKLLDKEEKTSHKRTIE